MINLILQSGSFAQIIMLILLVLSIWSIALIFQKFFEFLPFRKMWYYLKKSDNAVYEVSILASKNKDNPSHFESLILLLSREFKVKKMHQLSSIDQYNYLTSRAQHMIFQYSSVLSKRLSIFATLSNICPFIGLLGTVVGIIHSFLSITSMQQVSLIIIAPGIAVALIATALGLLTAIPASIAYNYYINWMNEYINSLELFSQECIFLLIKRDIE